MKRMTQNRRYLYSLIAAVTLLTMLLAACTPQATQAPAKPAEKVTLKLAMLPIVDALPFYVAQKQGYYAANNIEVSFIPAASAAERDQLISAGQADGMINDLVSVALYNKKDIQIQTVRFARVASKDIALYRVLASAKSGIKSPAELAGVQIGMSQGTIIDYVTSRLLEKEGLQPNQIQSVAVPKLPDRMALLQSGELKAATLPEPFGSIAQKSGAVLIVDDSKYPEYGNSVISFRKVIIDQHPEAIQGFLAAIEKAVTDINKDPNAWRSLLGEYKMVPANIQASYPMPTFPAASNPSEAQWKDVVEWLKARQVLSQDLPYQTSVTGQYLPK